MAQGVECVLINPFYRYQAYPLLPPLGLCYIAAHLEQCGHSVKIIDLQVESCDLKKTVVELRPKVVGISGMSNTRFESFQLAAAVKKIDPSVITVYGGMHASVTAEETLRCVPAIDIVARGESEYTMAQILAQVTARTAPSLTDVEGISYRASGLIVHNPDPRRIVDIDALPYDIRHFVSRDNYSFHLSFKKGPAVDIIASRGCSMNCIFCACGSLPNKHYRVRSGRNICDELEWVAKTMGTRHFYFYETFMERGSGSLDELAEEILRRELSITWACRVRVDAVDYAVLKKIRRAGCYQVEFGVESASERILQIINKRITLGQVDAVLRWCRSVGLFTRPFFMLGHPSETYAEAQETVRYVLRNRKMISVFEITPCTVIYPGTQIERIARETGSLAKDFSWTAPYFCKENLSLATDPGIPVFIQPHLGFRELRKLYLMFNAATLYKPRFVWEKIRRAGLRAQYSKYLSFLKHGAFLSGRTGKGKRKESTHVQQDPTYW